MNYINLTETSYMLFPHTKANILFGVYPAVFSKNKTKQMQKFYIYTFHPNSKKIKLTRKLFVRRT